ncbi:MAG: cardiolipin synthase [Lachnospiraceae bacterium]|nr:cardiolipin synthase [Lachnospiraceae bacterium]
MKKFIGYLKRVLFSRLVITLFIVSLQIAFLLSTFYKMNEYWPVISAATTLLSGALIIYIINRDENPAFKITWLLPICVLPLVGALLYAFVAMDAVPKGVKKLIRRREGESAKYLEQDLAIRQELDEKKLPITSISRYLERFGNYPVYQDTVVSYFPIGEAFLKDLLAEIERAEKFIFMEYFIVYEGEMWNALKEVLSRKAKQGVDVRLLVDGMCAINQLPRSFPTEMKKLGIDTRVFMPVMPVLSTYQNNRDHRKIFVIDGKIAYNGGINIADEYINAKALYGHWKDTAVKLCGDAVKTFTVMFLQLWYVADRRTSRGIYAPGEYEEYLKTEESDLEVFQDGYVLPYGDGPHTNHRLAENVYLDILNRADKYVHIMTPYFINDHEMLCAFKYAAERGVDVKIILPHIPDKWFAYDVARTYYPMLLRAGVKVYEYEPGFIHAKNVVCDDDRAVVGSINFDFRSLYHHYECATLFSGCEVVLEVEKDFQETLEKCIEVTMDYYKQIPVWKRFAGHVLKLFAPLL